MNRRAFLCASIVSLAAPFTAQAQQARAVRRVVVVGGGSSVVGQPLVERFRQQPVTLDMSINLKTAKALGVTIPPSVILRADQVIE